MPEWLDRERELDEKQDDRRRWKEEKRKSQ